MTLRLLLRVESFPRDAASLVDAPLLLHSIASTMLVLDGIRQTEREDDANQLKKQRKITRINISRENYHYLAFPSFLSFSFLCQAFALVLRTDFLFDYILVFIYKLLPQSRRYPERLHPVHLPCTWRGPVTLARNLSYPEPQLKYCKYLPLFYHSNSMGHFHLNLESPCSCLHRNIATARELSVSRSSEIYLCNYKDICVGGRSTSTL